MGVGKMINYWEMPEAYICERCGHVLEPNETELSYDDALTCKLCGSEDVSAAYRCEICEEMTSENEIEGCDHKVCRGCIEKKRYDLDFCAKVGESEGSECCLNSFLADFFTEWEKYNKNIIIIFIVIYCDIKFHFQFIIGYFY